MKKYICSSLIVIFFSTVVSAQTNITCPTPDDFTWWTPSQATVNKDKVAKWRASYVSTNQNKSSLKWSDLDVTLNTTVIWTGLIKKKLNKPEIASNDRPELSKDKKTVTCAYTLQGNQAIIGLDGPYTTSLNVESFNSCEPGTNYNIITCQ